MLISGVGWKPGAPIRSGGICATDDVYGTAVPGLEGQCLHAKKIGFVHPVSGVYMEFDSALPDYFVQALKKVEHIHV